MPLIRFVIPLLAAGALLLAFAPVAAANTYVVYACKTRVGTVAPTDGLSPSQNVPHASTADNCPTGGSLRSSLAGHVQQANGARVSWHFRAPEYTEIRAFDVWRSGTAVSSPFDTSMETAQYTTFPGEDFATDRREWCNSSVCSQRGVQTDGLDGRNNWWSGVLAPGVRDVWFSAGCIGIGQCAARGTDNRPMAEMRVQAVQWILEDGYAPTAADAAGGLLEPGPHSGVETVSYAAADRGSGLLRTLIELKEPGEQGFDVVRRAPVGENNGRCRELDGFQDYEYEYGYTVPCRLSASVAAEWDTASVPDGDYVLRVRLEDAAGNAVEVAPERAFTIDNVPPPAALIAPSIAGATELGSTLLGDPGEWNAPGITFSLAWLRCTDQDTVDSCHAIAGASGAEYLMRPDDLGRFIRLRVTGTSPDGTGVARSHAVGPVTTSAGVVPQCADGLDNDGDARTDTDDPACTSRAGDDEAADRDPAGPSGPGSGPVPAAPGPGPGRGEPNGRNASDRARLTVSGAARRRLAQGRGAVTRVRLRDEAGRPITGATVVVLQRMAVPGARWVAARAVTTGGDGRARYRIAPGHSRTLRFAYRSHLGDERFAATRDIAIIVTSRTSLTTDRSFLRNGQTVVFKGRLASRPVPRGGVVVDLQARVGRRWQTFHSLRTDRGGRWKAAYRFRSTTGLQTYTFRARVRGDSGYPYEPSISRKVRVRVRG